MTEVSLQRPLFLTWQHQCCCYLSDTLCCLHHRAALFLVPHYHTAVSALCETELKEWSRLVLVNDIMKEKLKLSRGSDSFKKDQQCLCCTAQPDSIRGPSKELSSAMTSYVETTQPPVTTRDIKRPGSRKKKEGKHSSSKTRALRCSCSTVSVTQRIQQHLCFSCLLTSALN